MTKYLTISVIIALALVSFLTVKFAKNSYRILPIEEKPPALVDLEVYNFQDWHEFSPPNGEFKVLLPTRPLSATENIQDPKTKKTRKYDMYVSEKNDGSVFMITLITFVDMPPITDAEKLMKEMMDDMIKSNPDNELRTTQFSKYNGYDSLDFAFGNNESTVDARTFVVGNTLYILSRIIKTESYNANEYNFFINSFDLTSSSTPDKE
ncbi:MAG: hypothetical protein ACE5GN_00315 [Waddliaceae bacterium]